MTADSDHLSDLLDRWRRGDRDDTAIFEVLRSPMRRAARSAIARMTGNRPNDGDIDDAVFRALKELFDKDPTEMHSLVGLAVRIASRRGQDVGRRLNRIREFPDGLSTDREREDPDAPDPQDDVLAIEEAAEREQIYRLAMDCMKRLPPGQSEVVRATVLREEELSDWANQQGKSYQAAHKQLKKALKNLLNCVRAQRDEGGDPGDDR